jgi:ferric-dicitrate binding protein FerR (iron transport regulator)
MDKKKNIDFSLIASYLSGECPEQKLVIERWLETDPENKRLYSIMRAAWAAKEKRLPETELDNIWREIQKKSGITSIGNEPISNRPKFMEQFRTPWPKTYRILRIAAALIVAVGLSALIGKIANIPPFGVQDEYRVLTVENGTHLELTLPDNTRMVLDAGSALRYPSNFASDKREVYLDGEAYFEVSPDPARPFIVNIHGAEIKVLGTKFNINGWRLTGEVRVVVVEGRVSLRSNELKDSKTVIISDGELSILRAGGQPSEPQAVAVERHLGWMRDDIIFEDAMLYEVLNQIERWYDIEFNLADSTTGLERVSVHIKKKSLADILDLLSVLTGQSYDQRGRIVYFTE